MRLLPSLCWVVILLCAGCVHSLPTTGAPQLVLTSAPELVAPGIVSSEFVEIRLAVSPDGTLRAWGSTDRPGGPAGWNIWLSRRTTTEWSQPEPAPFNSDANDFDPAFTGDGKWLYFFSNRPGGEGGDDLYRVPVTGATFGAVEHLGPEINTAGDEWAPSPSADGSLLLFASNRPKAKHDLYLAHARGAGFDQAVPLAGAINTPDADEFDATFLADGTSIVFSRSTDVENDPVHLWFSAASPQGYLAPEPLPASINLPDGSAFAPTLDVDRHVLYFSSRRPGGTGKLDVYGVQYEVRPSR